MSKQILVYIFILFGFQTIVKGESNQVIIQFEGRKYTNLDRVVRLYNGEQDSKRVTIQGKSENGNKWIFLYDDDIFNQHTYVTFQSTNEEQTELEYIGFNNIINNDTVFAGGVSFSKGTSEVLIKYFKTKLIANTSYFDEKTKTQVSKKITQAHFLIDNDSDPALLASIEAIGLKYCMFSAVTELDYQNQLDKYVDMTKKYPKSRYFAWLLSNNVSAFKSKNDIHAIYNCFDLELKKTIFGEKINDFLISSNTVFEFEKFENTQLPTLISNKLEPIVKDTSVYNLVIFSASWCAPCHKQIPLLKEIYKKYSDKINFTYISMDEDRTAGNWKSLMLKENIQWRSLMAKNDIDMVNKKYYVLGIPHTILVYPGGENLEIFDVRKEENYNKLIKILEN